MTVRAQRSPDLTTRDDLEVERGVSRPIGSALSGSLPARRIVTRTELHPVCHRQGPDRPDRRGSPVHQHRPRSGLSGRSKQTVPAAVHGPRRPTARVLDVTSDPPRTHRGRFRRRHLRHLDPFRGPVRPCRGRRAHRGCPGRPSRSSTGADANLVGDGRGRGRSRHPGDRHRRPAAVVGLRAGAPSRCDFLPRQPGPRRRDRQQRGRERPAERDLDAVRGREPHSGSRSPRRRADHRGRSLPDRLPLPGGRVGLRGRRAGSSPTPQLRPRCRLARGGRPDRRRSAPRPFPPAGAPGDFDGGGDVDLRRRPRRAHPVVRLGRARPGPRCLHLARRRDRNRRGDRGHDGRLQPPGGDTLGCGAAPSALRRLDDRVRSQFHAAHGRCSPRCWSGSSTSRA